MNLSQMHLHVARLAGAAALCATLAIPAGCADAGHPRGMLSKPDNETVVVFKKDLKGVLRVVELDYL